MATTVVRRAMLKIVGDDADAQAKLDAISARAAELAAQHPELAVKIDTGAAQAKLAVLRAELRAAGAQAGAAAPGLDAAAAAAAAAGNAAGRAAGAVGFLRRDFALFGGALGNFTLPLMASVTGAHLLADAVLETAAVLGPATVAFGAFAAAAAPAVSDIYGHMKAVWEVSNATGQAIAPLTGGFSRMAAAVRPEVYSLFGEALNVISRNTGTFRALALGAGSALDGLAARFEVAISNGQGLNGWLGAATGDFAGLGNVVGNLGGVLGNVMKMVPGYAQYMLTFAGTVSKAAESFTGWGVVQAAGKSLLMLHGALVYAGLGGLAFSRVLPPVVSGLGTAIEKAALGAGWFAREGSAVDRAAGAMGGFGTAVKDAAGLPWGWIAAAAVGAGVLAWKLATAKDATQQWIASLQSAIAAAPAMTGFTMIMRDQAEVAFRLGQAQVALAQAERHVTVVSMGASHGFSNVTTNVQVAARQVRELAAGSQQLRDAQQLLTYRTALLGRTFGVTTAQARGLLVATGLPMKTILDKSANGLAQVTAAAAGVMKAYAAMGQTGTLAAHDLAQITWASSQQLTAMNQLNQAWQQHISLFTSLDQLQVQAITSARGLDQAMRAQHASFTGASAASLALRASAQGLISTYASLISQYALAGKSTTALAGQFATRLLPALHDGILGNASFRNGLDLLAQRLGYIGPNAVGPLAGFFRQLAGAERFAAGEAHRAALEVQILKRWVSGLRDKSITLTVDIAQHGGITLPGMPGGTRITVPGGGTTGVPGGPHGPRASVATAPPSHVHHMTFSVAEGAHAEFEHFIGQLLRKYVRVHGGGGPDSVQRALGVTA